MKTRKWKVYGSDGHRQALSFGKSEKYDWSVGEEVRIVELQNSDITGTNNYTIVVITRNTAKECEEEIDKQLSDGFFENVKYGEVREI